ncbi:MAG: ABC transporter ATP-binding protein [Pseudomonadota bacterium]
MIAIEHVTKRYPSRQGEVVVLDDINLVIRRGEKVGILGRNGAGKSTLIRLVSGAEQPSTGAIRSDMSVSWPLAFGGAFQGSLTGLDNVRFICRIYGTSSERAVEQVLEFSELGRSLWEPVKTYSSGMLARFAFAISLAVEFDCFLIDEIVAVGDERFAAKCQYELFERRKDRAMIIVSHNPAYIRQHCDRAAVLVDGKLHPFDEVDEAFGFYQQALPA